MNRRGSVPEGWGPRRWREIAGRLAAALALLGALFFLPAGTLNYWQAWAYLTILAAMVGLVGWYLIRNDPELLVRRMASREPERAQRLIVRVSGIVLLVSGVIPGLDRRYGWSDLPLALVLAADIGILLGFGLFFLVLRENHYASRTVAVAQGQTVVDTGPYSIVRHPMYVAILLIYLLSPLALGSAWGMIPAAVLLPLIVARIWSEERVLRRDLRGYSEYAARVRFRLLPGVW